MLGAMKRKAVLGIRRSVLVSALFLIWGCGAHEAQVVSNPPVGEEKAKPVMEEKKTLLPASPLPMAGAPKWPYPATRAADVKDTIFGAAVADPFRWLEDASSAEVQDWMKAQDDFARGELAKAAERDAITSRLKELFYIDTISAPIHRKGRYFYTRRHATKEKAVIYWKQGKDGAEKVLFDPNEWSKDGSTSLGSWSVSWDGKSVAYQVKINNSDEATLYVMDVASGKKSEIDVIEGAKYAYASWTPKGDGFYYTWLPVDKKIKVSERPGFAEVRFHKMGTDPQKDTIVLQKTGDPTKFINAELSRDGHFLFRFVHHGWSSSDIYFRDMRGAKNEKWTPIAEGRKAHFNIEAYKDKLYVHSDEDAPRWRVFEVDPAHPERAAWKEVVSERKDATLESVSIIGGRFALSYLKNASSLLEIRELDGKAVREVPLPGIGSVGGPVGLSDEDEAYFSFESYTMPREIYSTSIKTGKTDRYARIVVPVDATPYVVEQVFYPSKDGTRVSMFIVRRKDAKKDGKNRVLLYGYGGFLASETPAFYGSIYPWLERGGIYAVANLRGGGEYGEEWHQNGMLLKKQNVFDDFIGAAEFLIKEGYTKSDRIAIKGGSNGGLLVGAAVTQRPDLFSAVLCAVPLLDMVRYHLFGSGKTWISEYGSADNEEQFKALFAYSPYHHVKDGTKYPAVLLLSADSDDRVDPMHARKFAAALQKASSGGPVLLRIERNAGHGGADLIKAAVEQNADQIVFALAHTKAEAPVAK